ncbi:MAG TPA: amino acid adenylation domain-containing protein, partial [Thermoanaerobaculia bacterium]|nr:amino acid adenylation domain-containing protein [Thermoanaerobaculia bacterium]
MTVGEQAHHAGVVGVEWSGTPEADGTTETVCELIEAQAQVAPGRTAIVDGETEIDYARLSGRANAIAGELVARGVAPGSRVGVCMGRTWELVATLLGVLRAGCAYVPLDPAYPRQRVRYMLEHARAAAAVVDDESRAELCAGVPALLRLGEVGERVADGVAGAGPSAGDLAYVIYTSGSTGQPKGVAVEHRGVVAFSRSMRQLLDDEELAGVLAAASVCFDASVAEILGTLSLGGTVVLAENVLALLELPAADRVRTCITVPSAMQALLAAGRPPAGLRCVVLGGEVLKRSLVDRIHALEPRPRLVNVYGPTEATVFVTAAEVPPGVETITIGKPVPGSRAYVLGDSRQPVAAGVAGELHLAGDQLARGYLHDEELTRQRFVEVGADGPVAEERLYATGDLCRWSDDGEIEFLGRVDQQVKVRGFRVELGEIESALESMAGVGCAAAAVFDGGGGQQMLVGYVVGRDEAVTGEVTGEAVTTEAVRAHLAERLPRYMLPQAVVHLDELPRLPNGKLDRKRLPAPEVGRKPAREGGRRDSTSLPAPKGERRAALLTFIRGEIASLLRFGDAEQVSADRSLDELGVDSLTAVELSNRLSSFTGRELPVAVVLENLTPAAVVDHVLDLTGEATGVASTPRATRRAGAGGAASLGRFQEQLRTSHPPFLAANAPAWSVTDKGTFVRELKQLARRTGREPLNRLLRTGSSSRGTVADPDTNEEREAIIWTTNLYLGLNRDREVIAQAGAALERFGAGMGTSAAASGVTDLHLEFETAFAELTGKPAACLFPTGFTANVGVVASLLGENDVVVMDQLCHASIVDGARLGDAK